MLSHNTYAFKSTWIVKTYLYLLTNICYTAEHKRMHSYWTSKPQTLPIIFSSFKRNNQEMTRHFVAWPRWQMQNERCLARVNRHCKSCAQTVRARTIMTATYLRQNSLLVPLHVYVTLTQTTTTSGCTAGHASWKSHSCYRRNPRWDKCLPTAPQVRRVSCLPCAAKICTVYFRSLRAGLSRYLSGNRPPPT